MSKKIILILILGLIAVGAVYAVDLERFTAPSEFKDLGDGVYVLYDSSGNTDEILSVVEYTTHDWEDYITNDTDNNYTVFKGENNTFNYTDSSVDESGSFELIEVNGDKYIIDFSKIGSKNQNDFAATFKNLSVFNKLNNVTPLSEE